MGKRIGRFTRYLLDTWCRPLAHPARGQLYAVGTFDGRSARQTGRGDPTEFTGGRRDPDPTGIVVRARGQNLSFLIAARHHLHGIARWGYGATHACYGCLHRYDCFGGRLTVNFVGGNPAEASFGWSYRAPATGVVPVHFDRV